MTELLHPKIVHFPIALSVLMPLLMSGLLLARWRGWLEKKTWWIAVALQAVMVLTCFVAMNSGEDEEDAVEAYVSHEVIHEHEEYAEKLTWASVGVLALMVLGGGLRNEKGALAASAVATAGAFVVLGLGFETGEHGGELVYEHGAARAYYDTAELPPPSAHDEHGAHGEEHDDD